MLGSRSTRWTAKEALLYGVLGGSFVTAVSVVAGCVFWLAGLFSPGSVSTTLYWLLGIFGIVSLGTFLIVIFYETFLYR